MMENNNLQNTPYEKDLEPGEYWWCSCGKSENQPFCDSLHEGSDYCPVKFEINEAKEIWVCGCNNAYTAPLYDGHSGEYIWLCGCKQSSTPPFCDGTHKQF